MLRNQRQARTLRIGSVEQNFNESRRTRVSNAPLAERRLRNGIQADQLGANPGRIDARVLHAALGALMWRACARSVVLGLAVALLSGCAVYNTASDGVHHDLMLLGNDPVSYFTEAAPLVGRADWNARHRHGTYRFASVQNRERFLAAPDRYAPQYGAFCAKGVSYAIRAGGDPLAYEIKDGRLFIFVNEYARDY